MTLSSGLLRNWKSIALVVSVAILVLASLVIGVATEKTYWRQRTASVLAQTAVLADTVAPALVFDDAAAAQGSISALMADPQIEAAAVYNEAGVRIASAGRGATQAPLMAPAPLRFSDRGSVRIVEVVHHDDQPVGSVLLWTVAEPWTMRAARHAGTALLLVTSLAVLLLLQRQQTALRKALATSEGRAAALQAESRRREAAEEALRQSQKMETLGQLTGGIAHDFNNLLQGLQGALELIARRPEEPDHVRRWSKAALQSADRGIRLTSQLLAFSRAQKLELRTIDVSEITARLKDMLPALIGANVEVEFDLVDAATPVVADATQLELAIINLCINARDAMPDGGRVRIATQLSRICDDPELAEGDYLLLCVSDTGVGMPEDVRRKAFDPFFTTKGVGKGTGLGLAQVYGIAKQAGGTARIESEPGRGATITLYLPRSEAPAAQASAPATIASPSPEARDATILVVDDDPGVLDYVVEALAQSGYRTLAASDGPEALRLLESARPDLMIIDYAMPGMTGAEVARRALERRGDLPVLFMSGYAETTALESATGRGVRLLRKPFDLAALAAATGEALRSQDTG